MEAHKVQKNNKFGTRATIGLLIENTYDIGEGFLTEILTGITTTAKAHDVNLICFVGGALNGLPGVEFDSQRNILYQIGSANNLDGLIIMSSIGNYTSQEELIKLYERYLPLPVVTIGTPIEGALQVTGDPREGMADLLVHLIEVHHYRRIAFICGPEENPEAEWRYQIYKDCLAQYDIPFDPDLVAPGIFSFPSGAAAIELLLDQRQVEFDVIVGANDYMALGALEALQARGFVVPYDVAVVGFDNVSQTQNSIPPLTTVEYPLFEAGETAVHLMVAKLAAEPVAEQVFFPAKLIVRRSCGCMNPMMAQPATGQPAMCAEELLEPTCRDLIITDLMQTVDFSGLNAREGAVQLVDAFFDEIVNQANGRFLAILDKLLRVVVEAEGDMTSWQAIVNIFSHHVMARIEGRESLLHAGNLLRETTTFIAGEMRHGEVQHALKLEKQDWLLHEIGQLLITMFDLQGLMDILAENIPRLGILSCYLVLYEDPQLYHYPQPAPEWSQLVLACNENGRIPLQPDEQRFPTQNLLPLNILPQNRSYTMLVEPLYFRNEQIGVLFLERGPREGNVYELLRGQIASALKGALLLQAHKQAEAELRQHRDHLDELVQERTNELATANIHLQQEIGERIQAEHKLEAYTSELERSNQELQDFAYAASHDLQEPLRKIQAFGDRLQQKYQSDLDEKGLIYLDRMQNAASRMQALIVDLLAYSRVRTHAEPFQQVDLQQIVTYVLQDLEISVQEVKAGIEVAELPVIEADASQMRQLFQNLIGNALKFHRIGITPHVRIDCQMVGQDCEMTVVDNGIGFDEQYGDRIFNVFERLHGREEYAGTGVGLAICRRIVERHGGSIRAQSKPGEGSRFIVLLPLQQAKTETASG